MKKIMIALSTMMLTMLIIGIFIYEKKYPITLPEVTQPDDATQHKAVVLTPVDNQTISYTLQEDELKITYNEGNDWIKVPVAKDLLFQGEYQGNETELMEGSYVLNDDYAAFLHTERNSQDEQCVLVKYSIDLGDTWQESVVTDSFSALRFRKMNFLNEVFGYVIISGGRTMSQEYSIAYLTHDGGKTWEATADPPTMRLIAYGDFVDEQTGFLSYGTINPEEPDVYTTQDGGDSWTEAEFNIPKRYKDIFVQAEDPVSEEENLVVLVNQGPNGDYKGGKIKGEFISEDNGLTWDYLEEVDPDETEQE